MKFKMILMMKSIQNKIKKREKGLTYNHLNEKTNLIMTKEYKNSDEELKAKIAWTRKKHFVYHTKALQILERLGWIFDQTQYLMETDSAVDLIGLTIVGDTGVGKSSILNEFMSIHKSEHYPTYEGYPVQKCLLKDSITGLKGLYSAILSPYGHPYADANATFSQRITIDQMEEALLEVLRKSKTRLYFIDEFQHAKGRNQKAILNQLKRTMLVSKVPFIPVGMLEVEKLLQEDLQLADRCPVKEYSKLEMMSLANADKAREFQSFLNGYEKFFPLSEPSHLGRPEIATLIFNRVKFPDGHSFQGKANLRHIADFLAEATVNALKSNSNMITEDIINGTTY